MGMPLARQTARWFCVRPSRPGQSVPWASLSRTAYAAGTSFVVGQRTQNPAGLRPSPPGPVVTAIAAPAWERGGQLPRQCPAKEALGRLEWAIAAPAASPWGTRGLDVSINVKVLVKLFQKLVGSMGKALWRAPQRTKYFCLRGAFFRGWQGLLAAQK